MTTFAKVSTLSSSARRALRAAAHHLDPVVMMGQHGLTPAVLHEIDLALTAHALIKVRAGSDEREIRDGYLTEICEKLACESVQHLGKLFVLWRNADGAGNADKSAEQDAAAIKASNDPHVEKERGPRSKLPSERAAERANAGSAAPATRSGGYAARGGPPSSGRGGPRGASSGGRSDTSTGPRWKYGETPPDAPRREGWAPKDRRGAARFGATEGGDDSRRRDGPPSYGAPRARTPGGYASSSGSPGSSGTGGGEGYRGAAPTGGRSGYGGNTGGGYGGDNRGGASGGGSSYGGRGGSGSYGGGGQGDGAPRARWGERREPAQGGGFGNSGGNSGGGAGGGFGNDRGAPAPRSTYSRGNDASGADRGAPRTGGGGGWGNRDGVTGKPSGFSRGGGGGGAGGAGSGSGGAAPRARRRFG